MKNITLVIAMMIMFSTCVTSKLIASKFPATERESSTNQELFRSGLHPKPHWPFPASHYRPTPFHLPQEVIRCLSDKEEVGTCFDDISMTFFTREVVIGSECCDAINKMNTDCEKTVFGAFRSPILTGYVKLHCSTVIGSTSPDPLLTPSPAPELASSPAPFHASLHAPSPAPFHAPSPASPAPFRASSPAPSHATLHAPLHAPSPALDIY